MVMWSERATVCLEEAEDTYSHCSLETRERASGSPCICSVCSLAAFISVWSTMGEFAQFMEVRTDVLSSFNKAEHDDADVTEAEGDDSSPADQGSQTLCACVIRLGGNHGDHL